MSRISREKKTISAMLQIFCRDHHLTADTLCSQCQSLNDYAMRRLGSCPFAEQKPACNKCTVHCYSASRREQVRQVMRYAGPRMAYRHPLLAIQHVIDLMGKAPEIKK